MSVCWWYRSGRSARFYTAASSFHPSHAPDFVLSFFLPFSPLPPGSRQAQIQEKDDTIASLKAELAKVGASTGEGSGGDVTMGEAMPEDGVTNEKETEPTVEEKLTSFFAPSSTTNVELRAAKRRIAELESQL